MDTVLVLYVAGNCRFCNIIKPKVPEIKKVLFANKEVKSRVEFKIKAFVTTSIVLTDEDAKLRPNMKEEVLAFPQFSIYSKSSWYNADEKLSGKIFGYDKIDGKYVRSDNVSFTPQGILKWVLKYLNANSTSMQDENSSSIVPTYIKLGTHGNF